MNPTKILPDGTWTHGRLGWLISATGLVLEFLAACLQAYALGIVAVFVMLLGFGVHVAIEEWDKRH